VASKGGGVNSLLVDTTAVASAFGAGGLTAGVLGKSFQVAGVSLPSFGVLLQALEHERDINVISRPHLTTMDNVKAELSVGQVIPFQTASLAAGSIGLQSNYQRTPVELRLDVTPHLNDSDSIRLEIDGEVSDVPDGQTPNQAGGPTTNKRAIKTSIVVHDGDTVVLGGLQKEGMSESVDKIPFLGDIPVLGRLFQFRSRQRTRQELLIVLTPYIVRGPEDQRRIAERKEAERREFIERWSAFKDDSAYETHVDYARKRGLLEEINQTYLAAAREAEAVRAAERALKKPPSEGEVVP
jgi:general secretion pathway protein D